MCKLQSCNVIQLFGAAASRPFRSGFSYICKLAEVQEVQSCIWQYMHELLWGEQISGSRLERFLSNLMNWFLTMFQSHVVAALYTDELFCGCWPCRKSDYTTITCRCIVICMLCANIMIFYLIWCCVIVTVDILGSSQKGHTISRGLRYYHHEQSNPGAKWGIDLDNNLT